jgi:nicotinate-nucleotide adenylyltransferase
MHPEHYGEVNRDGPYAHGVERLGVLGGTFDPVHIGHVVAAVDVRADLGLDRVLLVPAGDPWQKRGQVVASPEQRFQMAELACAGLDGIEVSRVEVDSSGPSVTADTLERLQAGGRELVLLLGADAVANMPTWRRLEETRDLAGIAVVERAGEHATPPGPGWRFEHVTIPRLDVSSSEIRRRVGLGLPIDGLTPPAVVKFIRDQGLYTLG